MYFILAQLVGFVGLAVTLLSYQCKNNRWLIFMQLCGNASYALQYYMLGGLAGCATLLIALFSCLVQSFYGRDWAEWIGWKWIFCGLYVAATAITWQNLFSLIPCAAAIVATLANWSRNGKVIRVSRLIFVAPLWTIYDIYTRSLSGILCELLGVGSILISIRRYGIKNLDQIS